MLDYSPIKNLLKGREVPQTILNKMEELSNSEFFPFFDNAGVEALWEIIIFALDSGWPEGEINKLLFNPTKPSEEDIEMFRTRHQEIYAAQSIGLAESVDQSSKQFFAISSSMYAGKSTLAAEVCDRLKSKDYRVITMVPHFMGDFITIRGRATVEDDVVGDDGFARLSAVPYKDEMCQTIIESLNIDPTEKVVIHFDEFSFMPKEAVIKFINYIKDNYPNVKVLLVGLDRNALGDELEGYTCIKEHIETEFACMSFVPTDIECVDETTMPTGKFTSRYVVLPNGTMVLDCGFLPIVVPKEYENLVYYTPSNEHKHMYNILLAAGQYALLQAIVQPDFIRQRIRHNLFTQLQTATGSVQEA